VLFTRPTLGGLFTFFFFWWTSEVKKEKLVGESEPIGDARRNSALKG